MPWKVYRGPDGKWCVHKLKGDGSKGSRVRGGCHGSEGAAKRHMRALYANEPKGKARG